MIPNFIYLIRPHHSATDEEKMGNGEEWMVWPSLYSSYIRLTSTVCASFRCKNFQMENLWMHDDNVWCWTNIWFRYEYLMIIDSFKSSSKTKNVRHSFPISTFCVRLFGQIINGFISTFVVVDLLFNENWTLLPLLFRTFCFFGFNLFDFAVSDDERTEIEVTFRAMANNVNASNHSLSLSFKRFCSDSILLWLLRNRKMMTVKTTNTILAGTGTSTCACSDFHC